MQRDYLWYLKLLVWRGNVYFQKYPPLNTSKPYPIFLALKQNDFEGEKIFILISTPFVWEQTPLPKAEPFQDDGKLLQEFADL